MLSISTSLSRSSKSTHRNGRARSVKSGRLDEYNTGCRVLAQEDKRLGLGVESGPSELGQTMLGVITEGEPGVLHGLCELLLSLGGRNASDVLGSSKNHVEINTVIGSAGRVQTSVVPVSHVAVGPGGNTVSLTSFRLVRDGASE